MAIIYLACAKVNKEGKSLYSIHSETVFENPDLDVAIHNEIFDVPERAEIRKLQEVERIFAVHKADFKAAEHVTIFCDDEGMARNWASMLEGREDEVPTASAWRHMFRAVGQRRCAPEFLAHGLLSPSIRQDATQFLQKNGVFSA